MYMFKNEYRLFTIVRYNYGYYNTPAKPNMHARIKQNAQVDKHYKRANFREATRLQENF